MQTVTSLIIALFYTVIGSAQTYHYIETETLEGDGYTYQCDVKYGLATLYNKENKLTYEDNIDNRTGRMYSPNGKEMCLEEETWTKPKCFSIVNQAFTAEEKAKVAGREFTISLCISPQSGRIIEVYFNFLASKRNPYTTIPVSVYRKIEVELKKNIYFTPTKVGKNLSYILLWWRQDPNVTIKDKSNEPLKPSGPIKDKEGEFDDKLKPDEDPFIETK